VPVTVNRLARLIADAAEIVPLIVSAPRPLEAFRILTVFAAPFIVSVLDAAVRTEPPPEVSQLPATVHEPEVVIVPEVPPVIVTLVTLTADVPAVNVAPLLTVRFPPVPVKARFAVARVALLLRVSVPPQRSAFVAMVNAAAAVGLNCTSLNSETPRLPKVIVRDEPELNTTVPVPADHDPLVDAFVHEPPKFHVAAPNPKYAAAATLTFPVIVFVPDAPAVMPPAMFAARATTVSVNVAVARTAPALTVSVPDTSTRADWVTVPVAEMTRLLKLLLAFRMATFATPVIVTELVPFVKVEPAPLVSQFPLVVKELVVSVMVPLVPPVIVTLETAIVEAFAVKTPPFPTVNAPPVNPRFAVARAVVEEPSEIVSVPPQIRARVAIVNVWADAAEEVNEMLLNSLPGRFVPANVIVPPVALVNVTVPVPGLHDADVDAFVQVPVTDHVDEPMTT